MTSYMTSTGTRVMSYHHDIVFMSYRLVCLLLNQTKCVVEALWETEVADAAHGEMANHTSICKTAWPVIFQNTIFCGGTTYAESVFDTPELLTETDNDDRTDGDGRTDREQATTKGRTPGRTDEQRTTTATNRGQTTTTRRTKGRTDG